MVSLLSGGSCPGLFLYLMNTNTPTITPITITGTTIPRTMARVGSAEIKG